MITILNQEIKGVTFDMEGTIVDLEGIHHGAHQLVAREVGVALDLTDVGSVLPGVPHFIGGPTEEILKEVSALGKRTLTIEEMKNLHKEYYLLLLKDVKSFEPRDGFLQVLEKLRQKEIKTAIGSLTSRENAQLILERSGLIDLFPKHLILLREDVEHLKPAPDVYLETARRMGITTHEQLVFEDSPNGIRAAMAAGSLAIGMPVYDSPAVRADLERSGAIRIYKSWRDIDLERDRTQDGGQSPKRGF